MRFDVPEGEYDVELTATDEHGNETTRQFATQVAANPVTPGAVAAGLAALLVMLLVLAALGWLLWRNRRRIAAWRDQRRVRAAELARQRQHAAAMAAHNIRLANHRAATELYQRAEAAWNQRRQQLTTLLALARTATGSDSGGYANVKRKRDEKVYCTVPGAMVDMRTRQGAAYSAVVDQGQVTVTTTRVVFNGTKKREWAYDKLEGVQHVGNDQTMMTVTNRKTASGVTYTDPETTRTYIELAIADTTGSRDSIIETVGQRLHAHDRSPHSRRHIQDRRRCHPSRWAFRRASQANSAEHRLASRCICRSTLQRHDLGRRRLTNLAHRPHRRSRGTRPLGRLHQ